MIQPGSFTVDQSKHFVFHEIVENSYCMIDFTVDQSKYFLFHKIVENRNGMINFISNLCRRCFINLTS